MTCEFQNFQKMKKEKHLVNFPNFIVLLQPYFKQ